MTVRNLTSHISTKAKAVPQTKPIPGKDQVMNNAGGFVFKLSHWDMLKRFLILGTEGGTYYVNERSHTTLNVNNILACIKEDGLRAIQEIVTISTEGRAPKNDYALMALALCASHGNVETKRAAFKALPLVARTGTHLFHFAQFLNARRGWGRAAKNGVANWYLNMPVDKLAYQVIKYQQRDGWSHRDLLRLAHPNPERNPKDLEQRKALFNWVAKREVSEENAGVSAKLPAPIKAFELAKSANEAGVIDLILNHNLPREAIPTEHLNSKAVWEALLEKMPMGAMVRNLNKMTSLGLATGVTGKKIVESLKNDNLIKIARLHPIALLNAYKVYSAGHGDKGSLTWTPHSAVCDALMEAFYLAFQYVEPSNKRTMLALDVSTSMTWYSIAGTLINPREASAVMAMVNAKVEPHHMFKGFSTKLVDLPILAKDDFRQVIKKINDTPMGGTDCSLPMTWAEKNKAEVDTFVVYTDNETYYGNTHPTVALKRYREATGINAKLIVVGMTSTNFTIADPSDRGTLDVIGFDTATPRLISDFSADLM